ncbi:MAG: hypothetical protein QW379_08130 [Thermoplasmata archaeon]
MLKYPTADRREPQHIRAGMNGNQRSAVDGSVPGRKRVCPMRRRAAKLAAAIRSRPMAPTLKRRGSG